MKTVTKAILASAVLSLTALTSFGLTSTNWTEVPEKYLGDSIYIRNYLGLCSLFEKVRDIDSAGVAPYNPKPDDTNEYHNVTKYVMANIGRGKVIVDPFAYYSILEELKSKWNSNTSWGLNEDSFPDLSSVYEIDKPLTLTMWDDAGNPLSYLNRTAHGDSQVHEDMVDVAQSLYGRTTVIKHRPDTLSSFCGLGEEGSEPTDFYDLISAGYGKTPLWYDWVPKVANVFASMRYFWTYHGDLASLLGGYEYIESNYYYNVSYRVEAELSDGTVKAKIVQGDLQKEFHGSTEEGNIINGIGLRAESEMYDNAYNPTVDVIQSYDHILTWSSPREAMTNGHYWSYARFSVVAVTNYDYYGSMEYVSTSQMFLKEATLGHILESDYPQWSKLVNQREMVEYVPYKLSTTFGREDQGNLELGDVVTLTNGTKNLVLGFDSSFRSQLEYVAKDRSLSPGLENVGVVQEFVPSDHYDIVAVWSFPEGVPEEMPIGFTTRNDLYGDLSPEIPDDVKSFYVLEMEHNSDWYAATNEMSSLSFKAHAFTRERICTDNLSP